MIREAFYDPLLSYEENYKEGPFGAFADDQILSLSAQDPVTIGDCEASLAFGIPAGPLLNGAYVKAALDKGFCLPMYKTVRSGVHASHQYPNVVPVNVAGDLTLEQADAGLVTKERYEEPLSITNSFGVPSYDPSVWQDDVRDAVTYAGSGQVVGLSFQGTKVSGGSVDEYVADWAHTASLAADTGAGFLEANLSCPNEGTANLLCYDIDRVHRIVSDIMPVIGDTPLWIKVSYFSDHEALERLVAAVGGMVSGFSTINTIAADVRTPSGQQALPGEGRLRSGVCGHTIKWAGIEMVTRLAEIRKRTGATFHIIGVGGVTAPEDYLEYRHAGADIVMSATGAMWNPYLAQEIAETVTM